MSFPRYESYKDSGIEWLGEVPEHWEIVGFTKYLESLVDYRGRTPTKVDEGVFLITAKNIRNGVLDYEASEEFIAPEEYEDVMKRGKPAIGDLLFTTEAPLGEVAILDRTDVALAQRIIKFSGKPNILNNYYLKYWVMGRYCQFNLEQLATGSTALGIKGSKIGQVRLCLPSIGEQSSIAAFLDFETAKIDALIAEQQKLIALLKEKRQAVISHAVTKGLDPTVPMKDSGIEWLGEVPEHWDCNLLKRSFTDVEYGISDSLSSEGKVAVLRMGNIDQGRVKLDDLKYVSSVDERLLLSKGDLLFNRTNSLDLIGKVGLFDGFSGFPMTFASYLVRLKLKQGFDPQFFAWLLNTSAVLGESRSWAFVAIGQCNLNPTRYGMIRVAVPPQEEQQAIAAFLDSETAKIDELITEAQRGIELLKERRSALISAAVTGKIDVREFIPKEHS